MKLLRSPKLIVLTDQAVFSGTSFVLTILTARLLSIEDFGLFAGFLLGIYLVISGIGAFVVQPFQVYLAKTSQVNYYVSFVVWFQLIGTCLILAVGYFLGLIFNLGIPLILVFYALGFVFHDFARKTLLALNQTLNALILDVSASLASLVALAVFYFFQNECLNILLYYLSLAYILPFLLVFYFLKYNYFHSRFFKVILLKHFITGKWLFLSATTQWWSGNLYVVASGIYLGAIALGALRLVQSLMGVLNVLLQAFENYILPQTAAKLNLNKNSGLAYLSSISRKTGLLFLVVLAITFIFSNTILQLAGGKEYTDYAFVLKGFSLLYIFIFISQPIRLLIRSLLLDRHFFYGYLLSLGFALAMSHYLLSNFQLVGAVVGLSISQLVLILYWSVILQKRKINLWKSFISF